MGACCSSEKKAGTNSADGPAKRPPDVITSKPQQPQQQQSTQPPPSVELQAAQPQAPGQQPQPLSPEASPRHEPTAGSQEAIPNAAIPLPEGADSPRRSSPEGYTPQPGAPQAPQPAVSPSPQSPQPPQPPQQQQAPSPLIAASRSLPPMGQLGHLGLVFSGSPAGHAEYDGHALDDLSDLDDLFADELKDPPQEKPRLHQQPVSQEPPVPQLVSIVGDGSPPVDPRALLEPSRPRHQPSRTMLISGSSEAMLGSAHGGSSQPHHNNNSLSSLSMFSEQSDDDLGFLEDADDPPAVAQMVISGRFSCFALRVQELDNVRLQVRAHGRKLQQPENLRLLKELAQVLQASKIRCKNAHRKGHLDDAGWVRLEEIIAEIIGELEELLDHDPKLLGVLRTNLTSGIRAGTLPAGRDLRRPALPKILDAGPLAAGTAVVAAADSPSPKV